MPLVTGASAAQLAAALAAIPIAEDDAVITRDYHNTLRAAILLIAHEIGADLSNQPVALNLAPAFLPNAGGPNWHLDGGIATRPLDPVTGARLANANSWMPVQLPDGASIQGVTVFGRRAGTISSFLVSLQRGTILEGTAVSLYNAQLREAEDPFERSALPASTVATSPVDNKTYKYFVTARLVGAGDADDVAEIRAIRITYLPA